MAGKARSVALIGVGAVAGVLVSLGISAYAFRDSRGPIPLEEIRAFTDVFGAVKANYVEPVDDKKLMQEAISGMLAGLDPHSAYLDADAFKDMQSSTQGEFGAHFDAESAELALGAALHVLERIGVEVGRVRIQPGQHAGDGFLHQFLVIDRFDVVGLDCTEDVRECADLLERYRTTRVAERVRGDAEGNEDAGDCAHADQRNTTSLASHATPGNRK